jgi:hypothetical protein
VTEWNEQNNFGAWSGLSRCIEGLAIFCIFLKTKNIAWVCICQYTQSNSIAFVKWNEGILLLMVLRWLMEWSFSGMEEATARHARM